MLIDVVMVTIPMCHTHGPPHTHTQPLPAVSVIENVLHVIIV